MKNIKTFELFGSSSFNKLGKALTKYGLGTNILLNTILDNDYKQFKKCLSSLNSIETMNKQADEFEKKGDIERADLIRSVSNKITIINQNYLSIESTDGLGNTALLFAAKEGRLKMVKDLIKAGANIYATNNKGENFYDVAVNRFKFINNVKDWIEKTYPELIMANKYNL